MSSYLLAQLDITDRSEYEKYEQGFDQIFSKYNGEILVVDENPVVLEGQSPCTQTVLIRFPSEDELKRWYFSEEYKLLAVIRKQSSIGNVMILKSLDE